MKKGRPRSERSRRAILDAALKLVEEQGGGNAVTIEAIAREAGVGKQTIYKWWGSIGDIYLEILRESANRDIVISDLPSERTLESFLSCTFLALKPTIRLILKSLLIKAVEEPKFYDKFMQDLIYNRRQALQQILEHTSGLPTDDKVLLIDFIFGLMWYRLLLDIGPLDEEVAAKISRCLLGKIE